MQIQAAWKFLFFPSLYFPLPVPFFITCLFFFFLLLKHFRRVTSAKSNRASSSENSLLVKSSEKTGKNGQNQFLKTLKVNRGSSAFQEVFSQ